MKLANSAGVPGLVTAPSLVMVACISSRAQAFVDRGVEPLDDRRRRTRGRRDAVEGQHLVVRHARFRDGRQVGRQRRARAARHAERAHFAVADERQQDGDALEGEVHGVAQHRGHRFAAAAVGHADDVDAGARLEQFGGEMRQAARAGVGVVELARIGLGVVEEFLQRLGRERRLHHQDLEALRDLGDRRKVLERIVAGAR